MANFPFQRLQADLAKLIAETPAGARLMSEPDLAKQMGVSRATLREAMRTFETQGLIRRRQGSGTYVVGKFEVIDAGLEVLESLETMARRMNLEISVSDLHVEQMPAEKTVADSLCVEDAAPITRVRRVMRADGRPVAYLIECGIDMQVSRAAISATNAPADVAKALEIQRDDVLLRFASQLYDGKGTVVDYSLSYFIPGYFNFHVNRRIGKS